jgi:hypothetical protein
MKDSAADEVIDADAIVIALPRRGELTVSGGVRVVGPDGVRQAGAVEEQEPVLAD